MSDQSPTIIDSETEHSLFADRPHDTEEGAFPGRNQFAKSLAADIKNWKGESCLVMALYGGWGSGKSSLKNLLKIHLGKDPKPISIFEFNPWQYSGKADLTAKFFEDLSEFFLSVEKENTKSEKISSLLLLYATGLYGIGAIGKVAATKLALDGYLGPAAAMSYFSDAPVQLANAVKAGSDRATKLEKAVEPTMADIKKLLTKSMSALPSPMVVVIDDIDRLSESEILEVMQLVKSNADFPNIIFLLLCERQIVASALNKVSGNRGTEFLEKIVQVPHHVPHLRKDEINKVLFHGLDACLHGLGDSIKWPKERYQELFNHGLQPYFRNLRHVYRFLSSFNFHFRSFVVDQRLEVDFVDLLGLETLRVFEPAVYEQLPRLKDILLRSTAHPLIPPTDQLTVDETVNQLLSGVHQDQQRQVRAILSSVFPTISNAFSAKGEVSRKQSEWMAEGRACHDELFEKYFSLVVPEDELSHVALLGLIAATSNEQDFIASCKSFDERGLLDVALDRLDDASEQIPPQNFFHLIPALFKIPVPFEKIKMFDVSGISTSMIRLVLGLKREKKMTNRFGIFGGAIHNATNLYLPLEIIGYEKSRSENGETHELLFTDSIRNELADLCVAKLKDESVKESFVLNPRLQNIYGRWEQLDPESAKKWLHTAIKHPESCARILRIFVSESTGGAGGSFVSLKLSSLAKDLVVEEVENILTGFDHSGMEEWNRDAVDAFWRAIQRRNQGKPEIGGIDLMIESRHNPESDESDD